MATDLILGTAGHIDHGKTALVRALTGVDTDRLPEEKSRGITIELGFAELTLGDYRLGIVDVPGHEKFVRNMLAGATGMDLALLVVAADDSVKPQTREHLEILRLLDLPAGVIALTKCDLPDADWIDLVEDEVRELVAGTFLADAPIVRTSSHTGEGIEQLRDALTAAAAAVAGRILLDGPFRMAIDRTFTIAGHGTVVTGSVNSGRVALGDELALDPGGVKVRVRGLQSHDRQVDQVHRGLRAAINIAGVHHTAIRRGQELASLGHLVASRRMTVRLNHLDSAIRPLRNRSRGRVHIGTAELMASVVLLDHDRLEPGQSGVAQLFLAESAVAVWGQPFVLRSESPVITVGGGQVLDPNAARLRREEPRMIERLAGLWSDDEELRASMALYFAGLRAWQPEELARTAGIEDTAAMCRRLKDSGELVQLRISPSRTIRTHRLVLEECYGRIEGVLEKLHRQFPLETMVDRSRLAHRVAYLGTDALVDAVLQAMEKAGRIRLTQRGAALAGHGPKLSANERKLLDWIKDQYAEAGFQPPTVGEIKKQVVKNQASVPQLIALAATDGDLVELTKDLYLHADHQRQLCGRLSAELATGGGLTVSQIRELLGTTRKYAVPLCEYLDRIGFTRREGDIRVLVGGAPNPLAG